MSETVLVPTAAGTLPIERSSAAPELAEAAAIRTWALMTVAAPTLTTAALSLRASPRARDAVDVAPAWRVRPIPRAIVGALRTDAVRARR